MPFPARMQFSGTDDLKPTGRDLQLLSQGGQTYTDYLETRSSRNDLETSGSNAHSVGDGSAGIMEHERSPTATSDQVDKQSPTNACRRVTAAGYAIAMPIKAGSNPADDRMIELKDMGYTNADIAAKLEEEFKCSYKPNSIAARISRVRSRLTLQEDGLLDDDLTDWHVGEDDMLKECFQEIDDAIREQIAKIESKRWAEVSAALQKKLSMKKYTAKACRERFEGLLDDTALLPIELDEDQEGRRVLRETRIEEARKRRAEKFVEQQAADEAKGVAGKTKKNDDEELNRRRILYQLRRKDEEAERARLNQIKRAQRADEERNHREYHEAMEAEREWKKQRTIAEDQIIQRIEDGKQQATGTARTRKSLPAKKAKSKALLLNHNGSDDDDEDETKTAAADAENDADFSRPKTGLTSSGRFNTRRVTRGNDAGPLDIHDVTPETLRNPRSILTATELEAILFERGHPRRLQGETQPQLVARLASMDLITTYVMLGELLRGKFASIQGTKDARIKRLQEADASTSEAGEQGIRATDGRFMMQYEGYQGEFAYLINGHNNDSSSNKNNNKNTTTITITTKDGAMEEDGEE